MMLGAFTLASAAAAGLATQQILSRINEVNTITFLRLVALGEVVLTVYILRSNTTSTTTTTTTVSSSILLLVQLNSIFFTILTLATAVRRLFFSPLRHFPGKKLAALTKLYEARLNFHGRNAIVVRDLHRTHGDVIRTGPNELSICHVDAVALLGRQRWDSRGPFYELYTTVDEKTVLTVRDSTIHRAWRGIWDQGFGRKALEDYTPRVEGHVARFISVLAAAGGEGLDIVPAAANLAFDIMADLAFGTDYGMQTGTGDPTYMGFLHDYMRAAAIIGSLRNLCQLIPYLPSDSETRIFKAKGRALLASRLAMDTTQRDVFTHLLAADETSGYRFSSTELAANAQLLIVAGADTTSSVIANVLRELALHPDVQDTLLAELRARAAVRRQDKEKNNGGNDDDDDGGVDFDVAATTGCRYLSAVIDETLRLWNPVPSGVQMVTGPTTPVQVAGVTVPPCTAVRVHHLALMTDERYFPDGERWWPERWLTAGGVLDAKAFIPFSYGPHVCVGKQLAQNELRLTIARTVLGFRLEMDPEYDDVKYRDQWRDYYAVKVGKAKMRFVPRDA